MKRSCFSKSEVEDTMTKVETMAEALRIDGGIADSCTFAEPSEHHGHTVRGEWLLPPGTEEGITTGLSPGQFTLCCRIHLPQIRTQMAQARWPKRHQAFFASFPPHSQQARVAVEICHT